MSSPVLLAKGLWKRYRRRVVVRDVTIEVHPGEIVGLLGPNGAGKSTTFNIMAGLTRADAGEVILDGTPVDQEPLYRRARRGLGYLLQSPTVFLGLTVEQNLLAVLETTGLPVAAQKARAAALMRDFDLSTVAHNRGSELSGGERRRVEMARALVTEPKVMLLDEPFAGIDPIAVAEIRGFVEKLRGAGLGVLLTDHNVREALVSCDRAYVISRGSILAQGSPQEIAQNPEARETYLGRDFVLPEPSPTGVFRGDGPGAPNEQRANPATDERGGEMGDTRGRERDSSQSPG